MERDSRGGGFAFNMHRLLARSGGNIVFSPLSAAVALGMAHEGARGATAAEIAAVLGNESPAEALAKLEATIKTGALGVANAAWGMAGCGFLQEYIAALRDKYQADFNEADFVNGSREAVDRINQWVSERTKGRIGRIVHSLDPMTRLLLTNAIHFKARWMDEFQKSKTVDASFFRESGGEDKVGMMRRTGTLPYAEDDEVQAVRLRYRDAGKISMMVVLPKRRDGLADLETKINSERCARLAAAMEEREVRLRLPKFKAEGSFSLAGALSELGVRSAFGMEADFSGMNGGKDLFVSEVVQKAEIEVDEGGTEASAATAVRMMYKCCSVKKDEPPEFNADHPFLYVIRESRSGAVLFLGRQAEF